MPSVYASQTPDMHMIGICTITSCGSYVVLHLQKWNLSLTWQLCYLSEGQNSGRTTLISQWMHGSPRDKKVSLQDPLLSSLLMGTPEAHSQGASQHLPLGPSLSIWCLGCYRDPGFCEATCPLTHPLLSFCRASTRGWTQKSPRSSFTPSPLLPFPAHALSGAP